jgi:quercetin dioxygenase-like cupin family protein
MKVTSHTAFGVTATVYQMDAGEKIARHRHTVAHTTSVAAGYTAVDLYGELGVNITFQMKSGDSDYELPANIDHEIRALEDRTIIVNMITGSYTTTEANGPPAKAGGVMLHDGTIVHAD